MFQDAPGLHMDSKNERRVDGRPPYDLHWKPINYKTWDGIFYAYDFNGF